MQSRLSCCKGHHPMQCQHLVSNVTDVQRCVDTEQWHRDPRSSACCPTHLQLAGHICYQSAWLEHLQVLTDMHLLCFTLTQTLIQTISNQVQIVRIVAAVADQHTRHPTCTTLRQPALQQQHPQTAAASARVRACLLP